MTMRLGRSALAWSVAAAIVVCGAPLEGADQFYENLYRRGIDAFDRGDNATAVKRLKLACFGFLDEPELLAEGLTMMALAQVAQGDRAGFIETFRRIEEVEQRFGGWSKASLAPERRRAFEQAVVKMVPVATLAASPVFSNLAGKSSQTRPVAPIPSPASTQILSAPAAPSPTPSATPAPRAGTSAVPRTTPAAQSSSLTAKGGLSANGVRGSDLTAPPVGVAAPELSIGDRGELDRALDLAARDKVTEAYATARQVADRNPGVGEPQMVAAELAYRLSRWAEALVYFRRAGDPGDERPLRLFYLAVTLYESGDLAGSAAALRRCLPNLRRTSYVDSYVAKILGRQTRP